MVHDVFISYASEDLEVAEQVCRALEVKSVRCWMAPRDVPVGADYEEAIVDAIASSALLVLILSKHSNASPHVKREIQNACAEQSPTRIIPLRIDAAEYSKTLRFYLGSTQWLDASTPPLEAHLRRLVDYVRAHLRRTDEKPPEDKLSDDRPSPYPTEVAPLPATHSPLPATHSPLLADRALWWSALGLFALLAVMFVYGYLSSRNENPINENSVAATSNSGNTNVAADENREAARTATPTPAVNAVTPAPVRNSPTPTPTHATPTPTPPLLREDSPLMSVGDARIVSSVEQALAKFSQFRAVKVSAKDGEVTLTGNLYTWAPEETEAHRRLARQIAEGARGVKKVNVNLRGSSDPPNP